MKFHREDRIDRGIGQPGLQGRSGERGIVGPLHRQAERRIDPEAEGAGAALRRKNIVELRHRDDFRVVARAGATGRLVVRVDIEVGERPGLKVVALELADAGRIVVDGRWIVRGGHERVAPRDGDGILVGDAHAQGQGARRQGQHCCQRKNLRRPDPV